MEEMEENEIKLKISKKKLFLPVVLVLAVFIIFRLAFVFFNTTGTSKIDSLLNTISYEQGDKADFYSSDKGLYFVTKDGVIFMNSTGSAIQWQDTYTMMSPVLLGDGDILGVSEKNGSLLAVYNTSGNLYKINSEEKITSFAVNNAGASALISRTDNEYSITAYTESGFTSFMAKSPVEDGIPVSCDISDDGKFLAVSYIYTGYTRLESRVVFYNLRQDPETEQESEDMVASIVRTDTVLGIVSFMSKDNFIALSDSELICVKLSLNNQNVVCKENWSITFENSINAITSAGKKYIAVALGAKNLNAAEAEEENTLITINLKGKILSKTVLNKSADRLTAINSTIIAKMNRTFQAFNTKGDLLLSYTVAQDVNAMCIYDGNSKALVVTPKNAYVMKVKSKGVQTVISKLTDNNKTDGIGYEAETETEAALYDEEAQAEAASEASNESYSHYGNENADETKVNENNTKEE